MQSPEAPDQEEIVDNQHQIEMSYMRSAWGHELVCATPEDISIDINFAHSEFLSYNSYLNTSLLGVFLYIKYIML